MSIRFALTATAVALPFALVQTPATASDNLVVYRVGDGQTTLSSAAAPVFLDSYSSNGSLLQSIDLSSVGSAPVSASGTGTVVGLLNRSTDGSQLTLTGYSVAAGQALGSSPGTRQLTLVSSGGSVTSTQLGAASGLQPRSAVMANDGSIYVASESGVGLIPAAGGSSTLFGGINARGLQIAGNQLYYSASTGIYALGNGLPTSATGLTSTLIAAPTNPHAFFFADLSDSIAGVDTLYVGSSTLTASNSLSLLKYSKLQDNTWVLNSDAVPYSTSLAIQGLTGVVENGNVRLYATGATANGTSATRLLSIDDPSGYNQSATASIANVLAIAPVNEAFHGVALAPVPEPQTWALALAGLVTLWSLARRPKPARSAS